MGNDEMDEDDRNGKKKIQYLVQIMPFSIQKIFCQ